MDIKWFVIVNPVAGNGETAQKWHEIEEELNQQKFDFEVVFSEYKSHEGILAKDAIANGYTHIICVGGDGTLHNVVNGLMTSSDAISKVKLGIIPLGTGNDWIKNYGIEKDIKKAIQVLKQGCSVLQDIGFIRLENSKQEVYFNNLAGIGFDGHVVNKVNTFKKLGFLAYLAGALVSLVGYKKSKLAIEFNGKTIYKTSLLFLIGLCKYSAGGMQLTQNSNPTDGLFDISSVEKISLVQLISNISNLFNGKIVEKNFVENYKTDHLKITVLDNSVAYIQADGELIGVGSFEVEMRPKAVQFFVPLVKS